MHNTDNYWMYSHHSILHALKNPKRQCHKLLGTTNSMIALKKAGIDINKLPFPYTIVESRQQFAHLFKEHKNCDTKMQHQGIALCVSILPESNLSDLVATTPIKLTNSSGVQKQFDLIVIMDHITDSHNIGAIIRSSAAFGVKFIVKTKDNAPKENGKIARAACGALEMVPIVTATNLVTVINFLKKHEYWVIGLSLNGQLTLNMPSKGVVGTLPLHQYEKIALVLGAEETGIRRLVEQNCHILLKIPMHQLEEEDSMPSLNVSSSAAVALYALYNS